jgi:hypothetical protein
LGKRREMTAGASRLSSGASARRKGVGGEEDEEVEAELRGAAHGVEVRFGRVLHRQAAVQKFVGLHVLAGELAVSIVLLREEAAGAEDHAGQALVGGVEAAKLLRRALRHAVDVAGLQRAARLV